MEELQKWLVKELQKRIAKVMQKFSMWKLHNFFTKISSEELQNISNEKIVDIFCVKIAEFFHERTMGMGHYEKENTKIVDKRIAEIVYHEKIVENSNYFPQKKQIGVPTTYLSIKLYKLKKKSWNTSTKMTRKIFPKYPSMISLSSELTPVTLKASSSTYLHTHSISTKLYLHPRFVRFSIKLRPIIVNPRPVILDQLLQLLPAIRENWPPNHFLFTIGMTI